VFHELLNVHENVFEYLLLTFAIIETLLVPTLTEPQDVTVFEKESAVINIASTGKPPPTLEWFHGSSKLENTDNVEIREDGTKHLLILKNLNLQDTGLIRVIATNSAGTCTVESVLTVKGY